MTDAEQTRPRIRIRLVAVILAGVGLIALALSFVVPAALFAPKYRLRAYFSDVQDLHAGAPVRLDGLDVGRVRAIRLGPRKGDGSLDRNRTYEVVLRIEKRYQNEIRTDSAASLITEGLLGNRYINIDRGLSGTPIAPGGEVRVREFCLQVTVKSLAELLKEMCDCRTSPQSESKK